MARPRTVPDADIYAVIRRLLTAEGEKAVAFGSVSKAIGLAPPTLVQRYGNREGMIRAALLAGWQELTEMTEQLASAEVTAHGLLKALTAPARGMTDPAMMALCARDPEVREAAARWRQQVETALAQRLGGSGRTGEAAILFAAWQGQTLWLDTGGKGFRLKDAARRLG